MQVTRDKRLGPITKARCWRYIKRTLREAMGSDEGALALVSSLILAMNDAREKLGDSFECRSMTLTLNDFFDFDVFRGDAE